VQWSEGVGIKLEMISHIGESGAGSPRESWQPYFARCFPSQRRNGTAEKEHLSSLIPDLCEGSETGWGEGGECKGRGAP
jgi:hypothetical protein